MYWVLRVPVPVLAKQTCEVQDNRAQRIGPARTHFALLAIARVRHV